MNAAARGIALLLVIVLVPGQPWGHAGALPFSLFELVWLFVGTAVVVDLAGEWRFRRLHSRLIGVWPVHRVYAVQPALKALTDASIPAFPRGLHHRTLLQFFGPYVPVTLLVPAAQATEAERIVRARLVPDATAPQPVTAGAQPTTVRSGSGSSPDSHPETA